MCVAMYFAGVGGGMSEAQVEVRVWVKVWVWVGFMFAEFVMVSVRERGG